MIDGWIQADYYKQDVFRYIDFMVYYDMEQNRVTDSKMHQICHFTLHLKVKICQKLTYVQSKAHKMA